MYGIYAWHIVRTQNILAKISFLWSQRMRNPYSSPLTLSVVFESSPSISLSGVSFLTHLSFGDFLSIYKPAQVSLSLKMKKKKKKNSFSPVFLSNLPYFFFLSHINFSKVEYICCLFSSPSLLNYLQYSSYPNHYTVIVLARVTKWILIAKSSVHFQIYLTRPSLLHITLLSSFNSPSLRLPWRYTLLVLFLEYSFTISFIKLLPLLTPLNHFYKLPNGRIISFRVRWICFTLQLHLLPITVTSGLKPLLVSVFSPIKWK